MARSRQEKFAPPAPDDEAAAELVRIQAAQVANIARYDALLTEASQATGEQAARARRAEHELSELRVAYELLAEENETLRRRVQELDEVAFPTMPLPDAVQREVLADLIDRPPAPLATQEIPLDAWVDVVPSRNGTEA